MIALWMAYATAFGLLLALVCLTLERALQLWRQPVRGVWLTAMALTFAAPAWLASRPRAGPSVQSLSVAAAAAPASRRPAVPTADSASGPSADVPQPATTASTMAGPQPGGRDRSEPFSLSSLNTPLVVVWCAASLLLLAGVTGSAVRLHRRRREWRDGEVDRHAVLVSADVGPAVVGLWRLRVVVPQWVMDAEPSQRRTIVLHEIEHRRARDPNLLHAAAVALALAPWNLALWFLARRLRLAIEFDCDQRVLRGGAEPHAYGTLLLDVGERFAGAAALGAVAFAETPSHLEQRIGAIAARVTTRRVPRAAALAVLSVLAAAVACSVPRPTPLGTATSTGPSAPAESTGPSVPPVVSTVVRADSVYVAADLTEPPERLHTPDVVYPQILRAAGVEGAVTLEGIIDTTGRVEPVSVRVVSSSHPLFDARAREAVLASTFRAGRVDGRAVRVRVTLPIHFYAPRFRAADSAARVAAAPPVLPNAPDSQVAAAPAPAAGPARVPCVWDSLGLALRIQRDSDAVIVVSHEDLAEVARQAFFSRGYIAITGAPGAAAPGRLEVTVRLRQGYFEAVALVVRGGRPGTYTSSEGSMSAAAGPAAAGAMLGHALDIALADLPTGRCVITGSRIPTRPR